MTADSAFEPGPCASRLANIDTLSPAGKYALLKSIADDISATFIDISKHISRGTLDVDHTAAIHDLIDSIRRSEPESQRLQQVRKHHRRREKQWEAEKKWMFNEYKELVKRSEELHELWKKRVGNGTRDFKHAMKRLSIGRVPGEA
ncbi:hypothetical protein BDV25DRAFT_86384 [Aspergillus avenaceus]|uniref:Uncharacterized protein n=1 Tax=Aspergillus avenaceus TaxID=36643 RepID=A0A5N6TZR2_ASPAV|nr:hypothetical protein BDV25DRAFT_86384 [Aspergillus avenaceus]